MFFTCWEVVITQSHYAQISLSETPYCPCVSRGVRRAYLCAEDKDTIKFFEHRRQWMVERMHYLGSILSINICTYIQPLSAYIICSAAGGILCTAHSDY
jgi:hypothetical protein